MSRYVSIAFTVDRECRRTDHSFPQFSVDDFEAVKTTAWEGVRNHQAKNYMKSMKLGDKVGLGSFSVAHYVIKT